MNDWQKRFEWLRDNAIFDRSWATLDDNEFLRRVDACIAAEEEHAARAMVARASDIAKQIEEGAPGDSQSNR